jgi:hypothetical protein
MELKQKKERKRAIVEIFFMTRIECFIVGPIKQAI